MTDRDPDFGHDCGPDCPCFDVTGEEDVEMAPQLDGAIEPNALAPKGSSSAATPSVCPSCELEAALVDDGQGLGLLICANCKAVSDILDETPFWAWPGNDKPYAEAMGQSLKDWMRQCHRELLGVTS